MVYISDLILLTKENGNIKLQSKYKSDWIMNLNQGEEFVKGLQQQPIVSSMS